MKAPQLQVSTFDWVRAERTYNLCEVLFKVLKVGFFHAVDTYIQIRYPLGFQDERIVVPHGPLKS
ncbi:Gamma-2-syntrophin [Saguinus oedipus]|uniref:Gamma-2-syntrophin n=1 Tax=Saguinus oedipus TaxID=9490 RepID=A0ABQ9U8R2_SAGOE|nr:Gamma-2-syntrophin [Saguinus oedipus]